MVQNPLFYFLFMYVLFFQIKDADGGLKLREGSKWGMQNMGKLDENHSRANRIC